MKNINLFKSVWLVLRSAFSVFNKQFISSSLVTFSLLFTCVALYFIPGSVDALYFNRELVVGQGQYWRLITSHFIHLTPDHLLWNVATLFLTTLICEQIDRRYFIIYLITAIVILGLYEMVFLVEHGSLGYSNIAAGGFALLLMMVAKEGKLIKDVWLTYLPFGILILFTAYELTLFGGATPWELITGRSISEASGIQLKVGHIVGILIGFMCGLYRWFFVKVECSQYQR